MATIHAFPSLEQSVYSAAARRLIQGLARFHLPTPPEDDLVRHLAGFFETHDFEVAARWMVNTDVPPEWHLVQLGVDGLGGRYDTYNLARSLTEALAFVVEEVDFTRTVVTDVRIAGTAVELSAHGSLVARVEPIRFEPTQQAGKERVESALKGLMQYGQEDKVLARLATLPGLAGIRPYGVAIPGAPRGEAIIKTPASYVIHMRALLASQFGITVKLSQAQELASVLFGARDWQHLIANADQVGYGFYPIPLIKGHYGDNQAVIQYYRTHAEAIWAFGQTVKSADEDLQTIYYGCSTYSGLHIGAMLRQQVEDENADDLVSSVKFPTVGATDHYQQIAAALVADRSALPTQLARTLGIALPTQARLEAADRRLGIDGVAELQLGKWWFTKRAFGKHDHLVGETFREDGSLELQRMAAIYKAEVRYAPDLSCFVVKGDYGRDDAIVLDGLDYSDCVQLCLFSGLRIVPSHHAPRTA